MNFYLYIGQFLLYLDFYVVLKIKFHEKIETGEKGVTFVTF